MSDVSEDAIFLCRLPNCHRNWFDRIVWREGSSEVLRCNCLSPVVFRKLVSMLRGNGPIQEREDCWHIATFYGFLILFGKIPKVLPTLLCPMSKYLHTGTP